MTESVINSFLGQIRLISHGRILVYCNWEDEECRAKLNKIRNHYATFNNTDEEMELEILNLASVQIREYFNGQPMDFNIPYELYGTEFQKKVWKELSRIPYGSTTSYGDLSEMIGTGKGNRAVANACGANPLAIILPCHRVVAKSGAIGGYTGGVFRKESLQNLEKRYKANPME